jgi:hypothetical protein
MSTNLLNPAIDCPIFEVLYTDGDELPAMAGVLTDVDLTGHTIKLDLQRPNDVLTKFAALIDAPNGVFQFTWAPGDLQHGIGQIGLIRIIDPGGASQSLARFQLDIRKAPPL